jgi:hypothetical protein
MGRREAVEAHHALAAPGESAHDLAAHRAQADHDGVRALRHERTLHRVDSPAGQGE